MPHADGSAGIALRPVADELLAAIAEGRHHDPHSVLGQHPAAAPGVSDRVMVIRALRPLAQAVTARLHTGASVELAHVGHGIWEGISLLGPSDYVIEARYEDAPAWVADDPYRYAPTIGELDLHLISEGRHEQLWNALGAHHTQTWGVAGQHEGTAFTVWAPDAQAVRVLGNFNDWDGTRNAMRNMGSSGVWELFVPGLGAGELYKFELLGRDGVWRQKADPMARRTELPPGTASIVADDSYTWSDEEWMRSRAGRNPHLGPMSVYEVHLGSWRPGLGYREAADQLIDYVTEAGFTHVEFLPLAEHPFGGSWGYQVTGYYAPTARFGTPADLKYLIDRLHGAGIGVLMDWVPGHFPKDDWALARFDGEPLYEYADPRRGEHREWGTLVFDYGRTEVRNFLVANASYWLEEFHVDGLRVDAVASMLYLDYSRQDGEWVPNKYGGRENLEAISFLQEATATAYKRSPGVVMIAEESTSYTGVTAPTVSGGLGFGLKWNMGWMHDALGYIQRDPMYRSYHQNEITFSFLYAFSEHFMLPISHDEVVYGKGSLMAKMPGDHWQQLANVRAFLAFMWGHPGKQLLFMGQEFGQPSEWSEDRGLDWWILDQPSHRGLLSLVSQLNRVYRDSPELWRYDNEPQGFEWVDGSDAQHNVLSFLRWCDGKPMLVIVNFAGVPHHDYRVGLPRAGRWVEVLNTDAEDFGGSGVGNHGGVDAREEPWAGQPASAKLSLPPLGTLWLRPLEQ